VERKAHSKGLAVSCRVVMRFLPYSDMEKTNADLLLISYRLNRHVRFAEEPDEGNLHVRFREGH